MEIKIATRHWEDDLGRPRRFHYFLTVDPIDTGRFFCENYGVRISEDGGESQTVPGITVSAMRIDELMTMLVEHQVGPSALADVVVDWL